MERKDNAPIFLSNGISSTLIIPIKTARRYGLDKPVECKTEEKQEGILIKKWKIRNATIQNL